MKELQVHRLTTARIPTNAGEFRLALYDNNRDDKEHLALMYGDIDAQGEVLVRVHSECFTGDVLGSLRCDCGEQLHASMRMIAEEGAGIILYLRQEGRGIGLLSKLRAYNLQDEGYDTVEANLALGHGADERDYTIAALMLKDLDVRAVRLITNNPEKIESLHALGVEVAERVPLQPHLNRHNRSYLETKVERMRHMLELGPHRTAHGPVRGHNGFHDLPDRAAVQFASAGRPFVTVTYAQSLDGSIATKPGQPLAISGAKSIAFTHRLRAAHDAILVGIGTVLSDDPQLTVRKAEGKHPRPVVLDTRLRMPIRAQLLTGEGPAPIIATNQRSSEERQAALEAAGAKVLRLPCSDTEGISLDALLAALGAEGIQSLMVEGGASVITSFMRHRLVDHVAVTLAPMFVGGTPAMRDLRGAHASAETGQASPFPRLEQISYQWMGQDLILQGTPVWA